MPFCQKLVWQDHRLTFLRADPSHLPPSFWRGLLNFLVSTWKMYFHSLWRFYFWPPFIVGSAQSPENYWSNINWSWVTSCPQQYLQRSLPECYYLMDIYSNRCSKNSGKVKICWFVWLSSIYRFWGFESLYRTLLDKTVSLVGFGTNNSEQMKNPWTDQEESNPNISWDLWKGMQRWAITGILHKHVLMTDYIWMTSFF